jgi:hypothetical protein
VRLLAFVTVALALGLAAGCGGDSSHKASFADARTLFHADCVSGLINRQHLLSDIANRYCTCLEDAVLSQVTEEEFVDAGSEPPDPVAKAKVDGILTAAQTTCA